MKIEACFQNNKCFRTQTNLLFTNAGNAYDCCYIYFEYQSIFINYNTIVYTFNVLIHDTCTQ